MLGTTTGLIKMRLIGRSAKTKKPRIMTESTLPDNTRRLAHYVHIDRELSQKYGLTFLEFSAKYITRQAGYSWEVETDAMDWETAISGIETLKTK